MDYKQYLSLWFQLPRLRHKLQTSDATSVFEIDYQNLKDAGVQLLIFDMDDTLSEYLGKLNDKVISLLQALKKKGFKIAVFSNSNVARTEELNKLLIPLSVYNVVRSDKPNKAGFLEIMHHFSVRPAHSAMVGDKLGSDMYGAYNAGIKHRVLITPFSIKYGGRRHNILERFLRKLEKTLLL